MPWTPTYAAADVRTIAGNLKAFFEANQVAALAWASPGRTLEPLTVYANALSTARPDLPHMGLVRRTTRMAREGDLLWRITHELTWEIEVRADHAEDGQAEALAQLIVDADNYGHAVASMHLNIPGATLLAGGGNASVESLDVTASDPVESTSGGASLVNLQLAAAIVLIQGMFA